MSVNIISSLFSRSAIKNAVPSACRWSSTAATSNFTGQRPQPVQSRPPVSRRKVNKPNRLRFLEDQKARTESRSLEKFQTRPWQTGDVYAPRDLSPVEMKKWGRRQAPSKDAFDGLNINPLDLYKNFAVMSEYISPMGRIKHRSETGLRPVNQRKIAKAIRRAIGLGLMPSVHRHPEILATEMRNKLSG